MSFLARLFGVGSSGGGDVRVEGDGGYSFEVVGESKYQDALAAICGGHCEDGHEFECEARLVPEPGNPYDRNAVRVDINGRPVAYLARDDAVAHHAELRRLGLSGRAVRCDAMINGGWLRRSGSKGSFGVELDLVLPLRVKA